MEEKYKKNANRLLEIDKELSIEFEKNPELKGLEGFIVTKKMDELIQEGVPLQLEPAMDSLKAILKEM